MILNWFFIYILIRLFNYLFMNLFHAAAVKILQKRYKPKVGKWILKILKDAPGSEGKSKVKKETMLVSLWDLSFFLEKSFFLVMKKSLHLGRSPVKFHFSNEISLREKKISQELSKIFHQRFLWQLWERQSIK